jgi:nucleoid-associated protein YgaU
MIVRPLRPLQELEQIALQDALGTVEGVADIRIEEVTGEVEVAEGSDTPPDVEPEELDLATLVALADPEERRPDPAQAAEGSAGAPAAAASGDRPRTYRVRSGDSLSRIAARTMNDGGEWRRLYEFNRAVIGSNPERLREGMELRIPQD